MPLDRYPDMEKPQHFDSSRLQPDKVELFSPLAAETKDIAGYLRTGGCTAGCGACCTAFVVPLGSEIYGTLDDFVDVVHGRLQVPIDPVVRGKEGFDDWERWLGLHDAWLVQLPSGGLTADLPIECDAPTRTDDSWYEWLEHFVALIRRHDQVLVYINRQCDELGEDGMCQLVGDPRHPKMCVAYPRHPSDIDGLDFCTYKFQAVSRVELMARNIVGQGKVRTRSKKKGKRKKKGR